VRDRVASLGTGWGVESTRDDYESGTSDEWVMHNATVTHWSTPQTNIDFIAHRVVPYWLKAKAKLGLAANYPVVLILDTHSAWLMDRFREELKRKWPSADGKVRPLPSQLMLRSR